MKDNLKQYSLEGSPIPHRNFKGAVDSEFINEELTPVDILKECTNLTPFRKYGSLVQAPGHSLVTTLPTYPVVDGFTCVDMYVFSIDTDSKEITLLIYKSTTTTETKIFITPFYNPTSDYTNYSSYYSTGWVAQWIELTESYSDTIASTSGNYAFISTTALVSATGTTYDNYFNCWFVVNTSLAEGLPERFTYVTAFDASAKKFTTLTKIKGWTTNHTFKIYRFPCVHNYTANLLNYKGSEGGLFTALPTQFIKGQNELRMPCGKENRPLLLSFLLDKDYLSGVTFTGEIVSANITNAGQGFRSIPTPTVTGGGGATLSCYLGVTGSANIVYVSGTFNTDDTYVISPGQGQTEISGLQFKWISGTTFAISGTSNGIYSALPTDLTLIEVQKLVAPPDVPAGVVSIENWKVVQINVTNGGSGYTANQTWTAVPFSGTNATGNAIALGNESSKLSYDGLWFDLQEVPQTFKNVAISAFGANTVSANGDACWLNNSAWLKNIDTDAVVKIQCNSGVVDVKCSLIGGSAWNTVRDDPEVAWLGTIFIPDLNDYPVCLASKKKGTIYIFNGARRDGVNYTQYFYEIPAADLASWLNNASCFLSAFATTTVGAGSPPLVIHEDNELHNSIQHIRANAGGFFGGTEMNGINTAYNNFLGIQVKSMPTISHTTTDFQRNVFILSCLIDNRDEVIAGLGTFCSTDSYGLTIYYNSWFNRRITGMCLYNRKLTTLTGDDSQSLVVSWPKYPYFLWVNPITDGTYSKRIHEIPLSFQFGINQIEKSKNGEMIPDLSDVSQSSHLVGFVFDPLNAIWYSRLTQISGCGIKLTESGTGLKWISNTNRYIDQDTTMNYTRAVLVGQTNGRYFLVGCKNIAEEEVFENDDMMFPNNYAVGVSQYNTFLRNDNINVNLGDKDNILDITNFKGYLVIIKHTGVFALDVNTDDEIKYRVIDTTIGRGGINADSMRYTPYGIIMPANDSVWLINADKVSRIMTGQNARLDLYQSLIAMGGVFCQSVYYRDFDELMIFINDGRTPGYTYVFIYSFAHEFWTTYKYANGTTATTNIIKVRTNSTGDVLLLNVFNKNNMCISKFSESSSALVACDGTAPIINWKLRTHYLPYATMLANILINWITLTFNYKSTKINTLSFIKYHNNNTTSSPFLLNIASGGTDLVENVIKDKNVLEEKPNSQAISIEVNNDTLTLTTTGTISVLISSANVVGVGTLFLTQLKVGDIITSAGQTRTVSTITDNTHLTVTSVFTPAIVGQAFTAIRTNPFTEFNLNSLYIWLQKQTRVNSEA